MHTFNGTQRELEQFNDIHQNNKEVLPYTEPAFIAYLKGEEDAPFIKNPLIRFSTSGSRDLPHSPLNTSSLEKEQLTTRSTVGQHTQAKGELTTRCKANGKIIPLSTTFSKNDCATMSPTAHKDVFAHIPPVQEKAKGKVMAPLTLSCHTHHQIRTPGKAKDQEHSSSGVMHQASQLCSANLTEDLQNIASCEIYGKSSAREQIIVELTNSRAKQIMNVEEFEQIRCWDDHAPKQDAEYVASGRRCFFERNGG